MPLIASVSTSVPNGSPNCSASASACLTTENAQAMIAVNSHARTNAYQPRLANPSSHASPKTRKVATVATPAGSAHSRRNRASTFRLSSEYPTQQSELCTGTQQRLKIDQERCGHQRRADDQKPKHAVDEIRVDAKHHSREQRRELRLPLAIDEVSDADRAGEDADDEARRAHVVDVTDIGGRNRALSSAKGMASRA